MVVCEVHDLNGRLVGLVVFRGTMRRYLIGVLIGCSHERRVALKLRVHAEGVGSDVSLDRQI